MSWEIIDTTAKKNPLTLSCTKNVYTVGEQANCTIFGGSASIDTSLCWQTGTTTTTPSLCTKTWRITGNTLKYDPIVSAHAIGQYMLSVSNGNETVKTNISYENRTDMSGAYGDEVPVIPENTRTVSSSGISNNTIPKLLPIQLQSSVTKQGEQKYVSAVIEYSATAHQYLTLRGTAPVGTNVQIYPTNAPERTRTTTVNGA